MCFGKTTATLKDFESRIFRLRRKYPALWILSDSAFAPFASILHLKSRCRVIAPIVKRKAGFLVRVKPLFCSLRACIDPESEAAETRNVLVLCREVADRDNNFGNNVNREILLNTRSFQFLLSGFSFYYYDFTFHLWKMKVHSLSLFWTIRPCGRLVQLLQ